MNQQLISIGASLFFFTLLRTLFGVGLIVPTLLSSLLGYSLHTYYDVKESRMYRAKPLRRGVDSVLVTGGSKGIGLSLAKLFARDGFNVVLVAQNETTLEQAKHDLLQMNPKIKVHTIAADLTREGACQQVFEELTDSASELSKDFRINYLVNNAGFGIRGKFSDIAFYDNMEMIKLNVLATAELTHLFGKWMKWQKRDARYPHEQFRILNVSSVSAFAPSPKGAVYSASKAFVQSFSIALHDELIEDGITVTTLCPGVTLSKFMESRYFQDTWMKKLLSWGSPEETANLGYRSLMLGRRWALVGVTNYLLSYVTSVLPYWFSSNLMKFLHTRTDFDWSDFRTSAAKISTLTSTLKEQAKDVGTSATNIASSVFETVKQKAPPAMHSVTETIKATVPPVVKAVKTTVPPVLSSVKETVQEVVPKVIEQAKATVPPVIERAKELGASASSSISNLTEQATEVKQQRSESLVFESDTVPTQTILKETEVYPITVSSIKTDTLGNKIIQNETLQETVDLKGDLKEEKYTYERITKPSDEINRRTVA